MDIKATQVELFFAMLLHASYKKLGLLAWAQIKGPSLTKLGQAGLERQRQILEEIFEYSLPDEFWDEGRNYIAAAQRHEENLEVFTKQTGEEDLYVGRIYHVQVGSPPIHKTYVYTNIVGSEEGWLPGWSLA